MKMLASFVLAMESLLLGFAILLVRQDHSSRVLWFGALIALLAILAAGLIRKRFGWILGWVVQLLVLSFGIFNSAMYYMGALFLALWILAIAVGRRGEAIRRQMMENPKA